ncbi:MAG: pyridoxal phosphate-dependent aminotransferase [Ruminococcus sp.]|nr:pyridoxal phosphate-dependent aminotransferase [Ruminococcus sp.]
MYDFDKGINRRGIHCVKWDVPFITEDITPMWIADMDFEVAPEITNSLKRIAGQGTFGYQFLSKDYYDAIINWMKRRHDYEVKPEEIIHVPNVVLGLMFGVQTVTKPGDEIILMTPVYGPFFQVVNTNNRVLVESPMKNENGYYTMDFEDLEKRITEKTKAVIICNPHNPAGRVWTREELEKLADICIKHDLYILSDDIHSELLTKGHKHTFISSVSEEARQRSLIFTSPTKAFNLAGIHVANCFIANEEIRKKYKEIAHQSFAAEENSFTEAALVAAYNKSEEWLDELNKYIEGNLDYFVDYIQKEIPKLTVYKPEGTYLVWVDFSKTGIPHSELQEYLRKECGVFVNEGLFFGSLGEGYLRFNLACPRKNITPVLEKMKKVFS